jgi:Ni,Fe-hydrogenase III large subunit
MPLRARIVLKRSILRPRCLGYVHKGIESLMVGASIERAARLAARTSGDSTVAYGIAFAHAVEAAINLEAPPRAR